MLSIISSLPYLISFGWLVCWFYKPHYVYLATCTSLCITLKIIVLFSSNWMFIRCKGCTSYREILWFDTPHGVSCSQID